MTRCDSWASGILEADPDVLRGEGDSPLARHVRNCPACADAANRVLVATRKLDEALSEPLTLEGFLTESRAAVIEDAVLAASRGARAAKTPGAWRGWAAVALAASITALFLVREPDGARPSGPLPVPVAPYAEVEAPPGSNVAVLQTRNPDITVFWLY